MNMENLRYKYFLTEIHVLGQKSAGVRGFNNIQDYYTIQKQCLESGKLFEDPEFPPTGKWIRPKEICKNLGLESPKFFVEGVSRFDVKQGRLGDCWFLAAMAALTANRTRFNRIVCKDNSFDENYAGIFHFRFWLYGKWVEVVVDDRLPVNAYGQLNCLKSNEPNEFWSALLEKAYAKLFGGYEALEGGLPCDAFEDFSGGISEIFDLNDPPKNLFQIMEEAVSRGSMMACSLKPDPNIKEAVGPNGLVQGHAYSVTGATSVILDLTGSDFKVQLVRLRNPWGQGEWNGSWSDNSLEWKMISDDQKKEIGLTIEQDGEFWMSYQDFISLYQRLDLCTTTAQPLDRKIRKGYFWNINYLEGAWIKGKSAGGCRNNIDTYHTNPQFAVELTTKDDDGLCNVLIALMQKYGRTLESGSAYHSIGFFVYALDEDQVKQVPLSNDFFRYNAPVERSIITNTRGVTARYKLPPGHYLIVPSTFYKDQETEFLVRFCFEEKIDPNSKMVIFKEANEHLADVEKDKLKSGDTFEPCTSADFQCSIKPSAAKDETPAASAKEDSRTIWDNPRIFKPQVQRIKIINYNASPEETNELKSVEQLFKDAADKNQEIGWMELKAILDGSIPKESRVKGIYADYKNDGFSKDICRSIIAMMDTDYSRNLKLDEFKKFYETYTQWRDAFQKFNKSGNWKMSSQELFEALKSVGFKLGARVINMLIYRYGTPYNTMLYEDFIMCAVKVTTMNERFKQKSCGNKDNAMFSLDDWIVTRGVKSKSQVLGYLGYFARTWGTPSTWVFIPSTCTNPII